MNLVGPARTANLVRLDAERAVTLSGFGMTAAGQSYLYRPTTVDQIREAFDVARASGLQVVLRGSGRSYGDGNVGAGCLAIDIRRMNRILDWNPETGIIQCEPGVTIEGLWRYTLEDGYWPPVVSGTMFPTLAGALGMNIHGKNNYAVGTLGDHVQEIDVLFPSGRHATLKPEDELFRAVISGAGLLGAITRVQLKMKKLHSGYLRVLPVACRNWDEQFETFERLEHDCDYMVSWIDCFGRGSNAGRGQFHGAWYADEPGRYPVSFRPELQDLPDTILGLVPKSVVWRFLKVLNRRAGMKFLNTAKQKAGEVLGDGKPYYQSLVAFSFLLDYVPNWRNAYLPHGFIQYQSFVPKEHTKRVFTRQVELQQEAKLESYLGVLKRHRPDGFLFSHAVDGYSLALDFKVTPKSWPRLQELCWQMNELVLEAGGRFYFAKDSTLRPEDARRYLGEETLSKFRALKQECDPDNLLTSDLARRLGLGQPS